MIAMLMCCDCDTLCTIKFCLLTTDDRIVYVTTCPKCRDFKSLRHFTTLGHLEWLSAAVSGLPVVNFKRAA